MMAGGGTAPRRTPEQTRHDPKLVLARADKGCRHGGGKGTGRILWSESTGTTGRITTTNFSDSGPAEGDTH